MFHREVLLSLTLLRSTTRLFIHSGRDFVGRSSSAASDAAIIDSSAPLLTGNNIQAEIKSYDTLFASWDGVFQDMESGK